MGNYANAEESFHGTRCRTSRKEPLSILTTIYLGRRRLEEREREEERKEREKERKQNRRKVSMIRRRLKGTRPAKLNLANLSIRGTPSRALSRVRLERQSPERGYGDLSGVGKVQEHKRRPRTR